MMHTARLCLLTLFFLSLNWPDSIAQDQATKTFHIGGFVDAFYAFDFNRPLGAERQSGFFNHNRHNEFNLNLAMLRTAWNEEHFRAVLDVQFGTYAIDNYAAEPGGLQHIYQGYAGLRLSEGLWLDVGVFESHIGWESAISPRNPTLTRSLAAENSPYFLTGVRVEWEANEQLFFTAVINNGWQRIQRVEGNSLPGFGTQANYKPNAQWEFNWSTWIGTDDTDTERRIRYFNNFYTRWSASRNLYLIAGFDYGLQQESIGSSKLQSWLTPALLLQWRWNEQWALGMRSEYYQDAHQIITSTNTPNGFQTQAYSINVDRTLAQNIFWRIEARYMQSQDAIFNGFNGMNNRNFYLTTSLAVEF
jgi:hypothetical protein